MLPRNPSQRRPILILRTQDARQPLSGAFLLPSNSIFPMSKKYWLMKSEPSECSFESVFSRNDKTIDWFGIRNYQARNFMRDEMSIGDPVLFYHSSCPHPGIVGLAHVASVAKPDQTQFDPKSEYFDSKSTPENPRWVCVDVMADEPIELIDLQTLRKYPQLQSMRILQKGNRLSITPISEEEYSFIINELVQKQI